MNRKHTIKAEVTFQIYIPAHLSKEDVQKKISDTLKVDAGLDANHPEGSVSFEIVSHVVGKILPENVLSESHVSSLDEGFLKSVSTMERHLLLQYYKYRGVHALILRSHRDGSFDIGAYNGAGRFVSCFDEDFDSRLLKDEYE